MPQAGVLQARDDLHASDCLVARVDAERDVLVDLAGFTRTPQRWLAPAAQLPIGRYPASRAVLARWQGRLKITATGRLRGDADVASLIVQEGGVHFGVLRVHPDGVPEADAAAAGQDAERTPVC